jgi:hypothetical protein
VTGRRVRDVGLTRIARPRRDVGRASYWAPRSRLRCHASAVIRPRRWTPTTRPHSQPARPGSTRLAAVPQARGTAGGGRVSREPAAARRDPRSPSVARPSSGRCAP